MSKPKTCPFKEELSYNDVHIFVYRNVHIGIVNIIALMSSKLNWTELYETQTRFSFAFLSLQTFLCQTANIVRERNTHTYMYIMKKKSNRS